MENSTNTEDLADGGSDSTNPDVALDLWNIKGALDYRNLTLGGVEDVTGIHVVSYQVVLPLVLAAGLVVNSAGLVLLSTPRLRARFSNRYYLLLLGSDLVVLAASVPTALTLNGCRLWSYGEALYLAHACNTIFYTVQAFTLYLIIWISYDRFLGLWYFKRFQDMQTQRVFRNRVVLTVLLCVATHLQHLLQVEVKCTGYTHDLDGTCRAGVWVIDDGLHYLARKSVLANLLWVVRGLVVLVVPVVLVMAFNAGIVVGLVRRRLLNAAATLRTRRQAFSSIYIALALSLTFLTCTAPIAVYTAFYADNIAHCHGSSAEEIFRAVANLLMIGEHLTHFLFLSFNDTFRTELAKNVSSAYQQCRHVLQCFVPTCPSSCLRQKNNSDVPHPTATVQEAFPPVFIISTPEGTAGPGGDEEGEEDQDPEGCPGMPLQLMAPPAGGALHPPKDAPRPFSTSSTVTILDDT